MPVTSISTIPAVSPKLWKSGSAETARSVRADRRARLELGDVGEDVAVGEDDALRRALGARR